MDLDFDDDKRKDFLLNEFNKIQSENKELERKHSERKEVLKTLDVNADFSHNVFVDVNLIWTKICNNQYNVGFEVKNKGNQALKDLNLMIRGDISYMVSVFERNDDDLMMSLQSFVSDHEVHDCKKISNNINKSNSILNNGYVVVTIDMPKFIETKEVTLDSILMYKNHDTDKKYTIKLPKLTLSTDDILNKKLQIDPTKDILPLLNIPKHSMMLVTPKDWNSSIDSTFEIYCSFTKLPIECKCKKYFYMKNFNKNLDDSLVVLHAHLSRSLNAYHVSLHTKDTETLFYLVHHMHKCIPNLILLPLVYYRRYINIENNEEYDKTQLLITLEKEAIHIKNFLDISKKNPDFLTPEEIKKFRMNLAELEFKTDVQFMKVQK